MHKRESERAFVLDTRADVTILSVMTQSKTTKKPVTNDWHSAYVIAALKVEGWSLRALAKKHGNKRESTLYNALHYGSRTGEKLIAQTLGIRPEEIWPSRYENSIAKKVRRIRRDT